MFRVSLLSVLLLAYNFLISFEAFCKSAKIHSQEVYHTEDLLKLIQGSPRDQKKFASLLSFKNFELNPALREAIAYAKYHDLRTMTKILNITQVPSIYLANTMSYETLIEHLKKEGIRTSNLNFLDGFREVQERIIFVNALELEGHSKLEDIEFDLEGIVNVEIIKNAFINAIKSMDLSSQDPSFVKSTQRLEKTITNSLNFNLYDFASNGEFATPFLKEKHATSIYYNPYKKVIIFGNTGFRGTDEIGGLRIHSTEDVSHSSLSDLFDFMLNHKSHDFYSEFYQVIEEVLGPPVLTIPLHNQEMGNCVFRSYGMIFLSLLLIDKIPKDKVKIGREWIKILGNKELIKFRDFFDKALKLALIRRYIHLDSKSKSVELLHIIYHMASGAEYFFNHELIEMNSNNFYQPIDVEVGSDWELIQNETLKELNKRGHELPKVGIFNYKIIHYPAILIGNFGAIYIFYKNGCFLCKKR